MAISSRISCRIITLTKQALDIDLPRHGSDPIDAAAEALKPFLGTQPRDKAMRRDMVRVVLKAVAPERGATPEMIKAGADVLAELAGEVSRVTLARAVWEAMDLASRDRIHPSLRQ
jgi:hypothetical protein